MNKNRSFLCVPYGSKLYGTDTPQSDTDNKIIYLPSLNSLLLGHKLKTYKERRDACGNPVPDGASMPEGGIETEFIPLQTFVRDFVRGQTYALEVAFAYLSLFKQEWTVYRFITELVTFVNADVYPMVGFAKKQTLDYVRRGERLNEALKLHAEILTIATAAGAPCRLDTPYKDKVILDEVVRCTGLKEGTSVNSNRVLRTLELNGRSYLETTELDHLLRLLEKLIATYGDRTNAAAKSDVDYKSLSHAVRVYQQAIELLDTGKITFPRLNGEFLRDVKQGNCNLEEVKELLRQLDDEVQEKIETTALQKRTPELEAEVETWLLKQLQDLYKLDIGGQGEAQ